MGELHEYTAVVNGHETTVQLTEKEAEQLGATRVDAAKPTKATAQPDAAPAAKARTSVPNKAR